MRNRNRATEEWVANRQGLYLGRSPEDVLKLIDQKGGDYYKFDLYPDQQVISNAEADFNTFRTGTPAMEQVADDMRRYYGLAGGLDVTTMPPEIVQELQEIVSSVPKELPPVVVKAKVEPQAYKDAAVEDVKTVMAPEVKEKKENFIRDLLLATGGGAALGAGAGYLLRPSEEELLQERQL